MSEVQVEVDRQIATSLTENGCTRMQKLICHERKCAVINQTAAVLTCGANLKTEWHKSLQRR